MILFAVLLLLVALVIFRVLNGIISILFVLAIAALLLAAIGMH